jgi:hypothetical protein
VIATCPVIGNLHRFEDTALLASFLGFSDFLDFAGSLSVEFTVSEISRRHALGDCLADRFF